MTTSYLVPDLERDEGYRERPYKDSTDNWTWGYGHKIVGEPAPDTTITPLAAYQLLLQDIHNVKLQLSNNAATAWWTNLDDLRQDAVVNQAFNLGVAEFATFDTYLTLLRTGQFALAAADDLHTLWAKQVGDRAPRIAKQIETGEHQ